MARAARCGLGWSGGIPLPRLGMMVARAAGSSRVAGTVARPGSHRTVRTLVVYGSSGRQVMTPAAGRFVDLESFPERQLWRGGSDDLPVRLAMQVGQEHQPALGEVRVAQAVVDRGRVAQRPPGLASGVDLPPHVFSFDAQLDETPRDRAFGVSSGAE